MSKNCETIIIFSIYGQFGAIHKPWHYGGQLKTAVEQETGENIDWKINKNLKMQSLCAVFNCLNRADREKNMSNYRFPSILLTIFPKK